MKDYKCAHCAHCNEIKYDSFFCDMTGYLENKRIEDDCPDFEADTIPAVNRWIPVEDALPENNEIVWVCLYWGKDAYIRKGYIKNEVWYTADGYQMCIIPKFWMHEYIPEPPESEVRND